MSHSGVESTRAVVGRVRQLPGVGHLAGPQLVEDLAGLGVAPVVDSVAWYAASTSSVSTASCGRNASDWSAVMIESRPNSVANHGTPAAMYRSPGPGPSLTSSRRSATRALDGEVEQLVVACRRPSSRAPRRGTRPRPRRPDACGGSGNSAATSAAGSSSSACASVRRRAGIGAWLRQTVQSTLWRPPGSRVQLPVQPDDGARHRRSSGSTAATIARAAENARYVERRTPSRPS